MLTRRRGKVVVIAVETRHLQFKGETEVAITTNTTKVKARTLIWKVVNSSGIIMVTSGSHGRLNSR